MGFLLAKSFEVRLSHHREPPLVHVVVFVEGTEIVVFEVDVPLELAGKLRNQLTGVMNSWSGHSKHLHRRHHEIDRNADGFVVADEIIGPDGRKI